MQGNPINDTTNTINPDVLTTAALTEAEKQEALIAESSRRRNNSSNINISSTINTTTNSNNQDETQFVDALELLTCSFAGDKQKMVSVLALRWLRTINPGFDIELFREISVEAWTEFEQIILTLLLCGEKKAFETKHPLFAPFVRLRQQKMETTRESTFDFLMPRSVPPQTRPVAEYSQSLNFELRQMLERDVHAKTGEQIRGLVNAASILGARDFHLYFSYVQKLLFVATDVNGVHFNINDSWQIDSEGEIWRCPVVLFKFSSVLRSIPELQHANPESLPNFEFPPAEMVEWSIPFDCRAVFPNCFPSTLSRPSLVRLATHLLSNYPRISLGSGEWNIYNAGWSSSLCLASGGARWFKFDQNLLVDLFAADYLDIPDLISYFSDALRTADPCLIGENALQNLSPVVSWSLIHSALSRYFFMFSNTGYGLPMSNNESEWTVEAKGVCLKIRRCGVVLLRIGDRERDFFIPFAQLCGVDGVSNFYSLIGGRLEEVNRKHLFHATLQVGTNAKNGFHCVTWDVSELIRLKLLLNLKQPNDIWKSIVAILLKFRKENGVMFLSLGLAESEVARRELLIFLQQDAEQK